MPQLKDAASIAQIRGMPVFESEEDYLAYFEKKACKRIKAQATHLDNQSNKLITLKERLQKKLADKQNR